MDVPRVCSRSDRAGVLVFAGIAWADKEKIQLQSRRPGSRSRDARKRADLGRLAGWTGGMDKPDYLGDAVLELPSEAVRSRSQRLRVM